MQKLKQFVSTYRAQLAVGIVALVALTVAAVTSDGAEEQLASATTTTASTTTTTSINPRRVATTTTEPTTTTTTTWATGSYRWSEFKAYLRENGLLGEQSEEFHLDVAYGICREVPNGIPPDPDMGFPGKTPAEYLIQYEVLEDTLTGKRTIAAIEIICPEHLPYLEDALSGNPSSLGPLTTFGDGHYEVGVDIAAGTYQIENVRDCYWERVDANGATISNDFVMGAPRVVVTIRSSDAGFNSEGCADGDSRWAPA